MGLTTDRNDPELHEYMEEGPFKGQQKNYLVLSEEERKKGFVRPYRDEYIHLACGSSTRMGSAIAETYARNPKFYGGTFCIHCGKHFPLKEWDSRQQDYVPAFVWKDNSPVGD